MEAAVMAGRSKLNPINFEVSSTIVYPKLNEDQTLKNLTG